MLIINILGVTILWIIIGIICTVFMANVFKFGKVQESGEALLLLLCIFVWPIILIITLLYISSIFDKITNKYIK
jgi:hypothetical protein